MSEENRFEVGQLIQVGTIENPPPGNDKPWLGRVVATDLVTREGCTLLCLVQKNDGIYEQTYATYANGLFLLPQAMYNVYPRDPE